MKWNQTAFNMQRFLPERIYWHDQWVGEVWIWNEGRHQKSPSKCPCWKGSALTCGCYFGSGWTVWSKYLFRHVFPSWQSFERSVGFSHHQTSEVIIRGTFQRYASQVGKSRPELAVECSTECPSVRLCPAIRRQWVQCVIMLSGQHMLA